MSTYFAKRGEVAANWHVIDATDQVLGRLAARIAMLLQGKHKPTYTPHVDTGDFVIVINAQKVKVTGKKAEVINYDTYSRYPGGRHLYSYKRMHELHPEKVIELAVRRMLPKSKMGRNIRARKLKVWIQGRQARACRPAAQAAQGRYVRLRRPRNLVFQPET